MFQIGQSEAVELTFAAANPTNGFTLAFPQNNRLNNVPLKAITSFNDQTLVRAPSGNAILTQAQARQIVVILNYGGKDMVVNIPYLAFDQIVNFGIVQELADLRVDLTKSKIRVCGSLTIPANTSMLFNFMWK